MLDFVSGDLISFHADAIVHQTNCVTSKAKGLAQSIFEKYPYANIYADKSTTQCRTMGAVFYRYPPSNFRAIAKNQDNKEESSTQPSPIVVALCSQICPGKSGNYAHLYGVDSDADTSDKRLDAFKQCLKLFQQELYQAQSEISRIKTIAFPDKIGCGFGGGDWTLYKAALEDFARGVPSDVKVYVVTLPTISENSSNNA